MTIQCVTALSKGFRFSNVEWGERFKWKRKKNVAVNIFVQECLLAAPFKRLSWTAIWSLVAQCEDKGSSTCVFSEPPACPENVPTVVENLVVGKVSFCQCVTSHHSMKWHVLKIFWGLLGKPLYKQLKKLVCFLPQFVNRMLWVGFGRCRLFFSPWHSPTCRLMLPNGKGAEI